MGGGGDREGGIRWGQDSNGLAMDGRPFAPAGEPIAATGELPASPPEPTRGVSHRHLPSASKQGNNVSRLTRQSPNVSAGVGSWGLDPASRPALPWGRYLLGRRSRRALVSCWERGGCFPGCVASISPEGNTELQTGKEIKSL